MHQDLIEINVFENTVFGIEDCYVIVLLFDIKI